MDNVNLSLELLVTDTFLLTHEEKEGILKNLHLFDEEKKNKLLRILSRHQESFKDLNLKYAEECQKKYTFWQKFFGRLTNLANHD